MFLMCNWKVKMEKKENEKNGNMDKLENWTNETLKHGNIGTMGQLTNCKSGKLKRKKTVEKMK